MRESKPRGEFEGVDLGEALKQASERLGVPESELDFEILQQGRRGLFGIGARTVRIRVMPSLDEELPDSARRRPRERPAVEARGEAVPAERGGRRHAEAAPGVAPAERGGRRHAEAAPGTASREAGESTGGRRRRSRRRGRRGGGGTGAGGGGADRDVQNAAVAREPRDPRRDPEVEAEPPVDRPAPPAEQVAAVEVMLGRMLELVGIDATASAAGQPGGVRVALEGPGCDDLFEQESSVLGAMQFLLNRMTRRAWPDAGRIQVTCGGQGPERDGDLLEQVREIADEVLSTGRPRRLPPLNSYERRIVHIAVREMKGLGSKSEGDGAQKRVRIFKARGRRGGRNRSSREG